MTRNRRAGVLLLCAVADFVKRTNFATGERGHDGIPSFRQGWCTSAA